MAVRRALKRQAQKTLRRRIFLKGKPTCIANDTDTTSTADTETTNTDTVKEEALNTTSLTSINGENEEGGNGNSNNATSNARTYQEWGSVITAAWNKQVESIIEVGKLLNDARAELDDDDWSVML